MCASAIRGRPVSDALALRDRETAEQRMYSQWRRNASYFTGVAIHQSQSGSGGRHIPVINTDGVTVGTGNVQDRAQTPRISRLLVELIPTLPPMDKGYFKVTSNRSLFSFGVFGTTSAVVGAVGGAASAAADPLRRQGGRGPAPTMG